MSETNLKNNIRRMIQREFPKVYFFKAADKFTSGIPDLIMCVCGTFVAIELKFGENNATPLQRFMIDNINKAGGFATVCRSVAEVRQLLKELTCRAI